MTHSMNYGPGIGAAGGATSLYMVINPFGIEDGLQGTWVGTQVGFAVGAGVGAGVFFGPSGSLAFKLTTSEGAFLYANFASFKLEFAPDYEGDGIGSR